MPPDVGTSDPGDTKGEDQQGSVPPGYVPRERLNDEIAKKQASETALARSQGEVEALKFTAVKPAETQQRREYTRAELNAAVESGQISQDDADSTHDRQLREQITTEVLSKVDEKTKNSDKGRLVGAELDRYSAAEPDILIDGTDVRKKVQAEYNYLLSHGHSAGVETQLAACRAAFGPVEALAQKGKRETHQETGGGDGGGNEKTAPKEGSWPKDMPAKNRQYYEGMIAKGVHTQDSAVAEWGYKAA